MLNASVKQFDATEAEMARLWPIANSSLMQ
jgi:hypothetical protein